LLINRIIYSQLKNWLQLSNCNFDNYNSTLTYFEWISIKYNRIEYLIIQSTYKWLCIRLYYYIIKCKRDKRNIIIDVN